MKDGAPNHDPLKKKEEQERESSVEWRGGKQLDALSMDHAYAR